jgi:hypothetical protein
MFIHKIVLESPVTYNYGQKFPSEESGFASTGVSLHSVDWIVWTPCIAVVVS